MDRNKQQLWRANATAEPLNAHCCLYLGNDELVANNIRAFYSLHGYKFSVLKAKSEREVNDIVAKNRIAFVLAHVSDPSLAGQSLSPSFPLPAVWSPPLVIAVNKEPNSNELENFRRQGAILVVGSMDSSMKHEKELLSIISGKAYKYHATSLLKVLWASVKNEGLMMLVVVSSKGWHGSIYIENNMLVHAETLSKVGLDALIELIPLQNTWCQEHRVFIPPPEAMTFLPLNEAILRAMGKLDEQGDWSSGFSHPSESPDIANVFISASASSRHDIGRQQKLERLSEKAPQPPAAHVKTSSESHGATLIEFPRGFQNREEKTSQNHDREITQTDKGRTTMGQLANLLSIGDKLNGLVCADFSGTVVEEHGEIDGQTAAAVAQLSEGTVAEIGDLLDLGAPRQWVSQSADNAIYVIIGRDALVTAVGEPVNSPLISLNKLVTGGGN
ncbi:MAG: DUF4388 domain-containing protein [Deltaproteobacteria bacterium]|nr:DUF4388 domain-containing protein [Deltaproteobacteria bacterium]